MESFLYDYRDPSSPLARVLQSMNASAPTKDQLRIASDHLLNLMNAPGSVIRLARSGSSAPRGETVSGNWVFSLSLGCCRGTYWAVVSRIGAVPAYNYGAE